MRGGYGIFYSPIYFQIAYVVNAIGVIGVPASSRRITLAPAEDEVTDYNSDFQANDSSNLRA